jgi:hypothetical protein
MQFVVFAKTRSDNLLQIESHEERNLSDWRSKRKSVATRLWRVNVASHARPAETWPEEKAAGFRVNPAAQFREFSFA